MDYLKILDLYQDYSIPSQTEGHKHCRPGWINTACPFCIGNEGLHLGYDLEDNYFRCWRCGWHPVAETIAALVGVHASESRLLLKQYGGIAKVEEAPTAQPRPKAHKLPSGIKSLQRQHQSYLVKRGFDPEKIARKWGLLGTGPVSSLDGADYKHRILAPIRWHDSQVSFQTRDITNKAKHKYKACTKERELVHHKEILYGDQSEWGDVGICVEGVTDVWRFGPKAFAVFGIGFKTPQIRAIIQAKFKRVFVVFDNDPQAQIQANKLVSELKFAGVKAFQTTILNGDPAAMKQDDADSLVKELTK